MSDYMVIAMFLVWFYFPTVVSLLICRSGLPMFFRLFMILSIILGNVWLGVIVFRSVSGGG